MPYYYKREINDLNGTGKTQYRYEVRSEGRVGLDYLAHVVQRRHRALSEGEVYGIVCSTIDALTSALAEGHSVTLDGLGNFSVGIGLIDRTSMRRRWGFPDIPSALAGEETEEGEAEPNARSIGVRTVHFKASPDLIGEVDRRCKLKREPGGAAHIRQSPYTREERIHRALAHIDMNGFMRLDDYARLGGLSRTVASQELRAICADPGSPVTSNGAGSAKVYVRRTSAL
ncbi:MAG: hypothetical protein IJT75_10220 [Bacteroidaceae bacterium]|nr:hypothetical protein [Bacteroidaceae bacterium]